MSKKFDTGDADVRFLMGLTNAQLRAQGVEEDDIKALREEQWGQAPDNVTEEQQQEVERVLASTYRAPIEKVFGKRAATRAEEKAAPAATKKGGE